jgi:hypothetical protein
VIIQPIVEGQGDVDAVPLLLRRLRDEAQAWGLEVAKPQRTPRTRLIKKEFLQDSVRLASLTAHCTGILILFDADDDCPKTLAQTLEQWAQEAAGKTPCAVVLANREYESWFLASMETLRGKAGILPQAASHPVPESPRNAKGEIEQRMPPGMSYSPSVDQAPLTALLDLKSAYQRCRSFRKLVTAFGRLATASGAPPAEWPPADWVR